jgi:hypothetical protein
MRKLLLGVIGLALAGTACAVPTSSAQSGTSDKTITGTVAVTDTDAHWISVGASCTGTGGYSDQAEGAQVTVTNETGRTIGLGTYDAGSVTSVGTCTFPFAVTGLPSAQVYSIEATHRGQLHYTPAQLDQENWNVSLTLGNS